MAVRRNANITKALVDGLKAGSLVWDRRVSGFGVRRQKTAAVFVLKTVAHDGRTRWFTIGKYGSPYTVEQARDQASIMLGRIKNGEDLVAEREKTPIAEQTVNDVAERFFKEHGTKLKPRTLEEYRRLHKNYIGPRFGKRDIASITVADIKPAHAAWETHKRAANHAMAMFSKLMSWCEEHELRPHGTNPCRTLKKYKEEKRKRYLNDEEIGALAAALDKAETSTDPKIAINRYAAYAIRLLLLTGARRNEVLSLKWSYVDLQRKLLMLPDSKTGAKTIVLSDLAAELLASIPRIQGNPYVIAGSNPAEHYVGLFKCWDRVRKAAGLADVHLHDLRHTYASVAINNGASLAVVGRALGHKQLQTTERYAHLTQDPVRELARATGQAIAQAMKGKATDTGSTEQTAKQST